MSIREEHYTEEELSWLDRFDYATWIEGEACFELFTAFLIIAPNRRIAKTRLREALRKFFPEFRKRDTYEGIEFLNRELEEAKQILLRRIEPMRQFKEWYLENCDEDDYMDLYRGLRAITPYVYETGNF